MVVLTFCNVGFYGSSTAMIVLEPNGKKLKTAICKARFKEEQSKEWKTK